ncbi:MAG: hypothetical protein LUH11_02395, partial [Candidatus Gastranaerophilales bacterium]|nr:hypothetical protein [Candidatus Gastranaerophilales bacterium]
MVCFNPTIAVYPAVKNIDGKRPLIFSRDLLKGYDITSSIVREFCKPDNILGFKIKVPCNKCLGCKMDNSRMWALRSVHESKLHAHNCFITLTFNNKHLPDNNSIDKVFI